MSTWWKDLREVCREGEKGRWFDQNVEWKVGSGSIIKFWEDTWIGLNPLKLRLPRLYGNSILKDKVIKGVWEMGKQQMGMGSKMEKEMVSVGVASS